MTYKVFKYQQPFELESGAILPELKIGYHTYGQLNASRDNVIWVCHALTANADPLDWWYGLFGEHELFNPQEHFIVCANILGSCYGSIGPLSEDPRTGEPYYHDFPFVTVRDMVRAHQLLADHIGIDQIHFLTGGSLGGQQALEWAIQEPDLVENLGLVACNAWHSPWGIAFNESQRMAIEADQTWREKSPNAGLKGLRTARSIALLSYRNAETYRFKQEEAHNEKLDGFNAASYQQYQGTKLAQRFNAFSYWYLSKAMDTHNVGRNRDSVEAALKRIQANTLVIGIQSDILFPIQEQAYLARNIPHADVVGIDSRYGHDGFLIETDQLAQILSERLNLKTRQSWPFWSTFDKTKATYD